MKSLLLLLFLTPVLNYAAPEKKEQQFSIEELLNQIDKKFGKVKNPKNPDCKNILRARL